MAKCALMNWKASSNFCRDTWSSSLMVSCVFWIDCTRSSRSRRRKLFALLAFLEFFERHHVHRAHRFDARLHLVVVRFGRDQVLAHELLILLRHQLFGLRVQFGDARLPQVIAVRVVARLFDLALAALGAKFVERLALAAQRFFDLRRCACEPVPIRLRAPPSALRGAAFPSEVPRPAARSARRSLRSWLSPRAGPRAAVCNESTRSVACAISSARRASNASALARRSAIAASSSRRATTCSCSPWKSSRRVRDSLGGGCAFGFGSGARADRLGVLLARAFGARAGRFRVGAKPRDLFAFGCELLRRAMRFVARLIALMRGGNERFFRFHLLRGRGQAMCASAAAICSSRRG